MTINKDKNLNALRMLGVQMINKANSGHPGIVLGAAPIVYVLFNKILNINPKNSKWLNRDRFVLSAGHGSALLYSALHLSGFNLSIDDLKEFRQWKSLTPGHPESTLTDGVEVTTGPLGQGIAMGVGIATSEAHLSSVFNKDKLNIFNHYTYILCGDGDLQEGVSQEAISFAGHNKLNKIILIHDSNDIQLDTRVDLVQSENLIDRFKSANWNTITVCDGENTDEIEKAILLAQKSDKPTYIEVKTIIGIGCSKQGTSQVHGSPLGNSIEEVKKSFDWNYDDFIIPQEIYDNWSAIVKNGEEKNNKWNETLSEYKKNYSKEYDLLNNFLNKKIDFDFKELLELTPNSDQATRISSGIIFDKISSVVKNIIGGSADLSSSTKIKGSDGNFSPSNYESRNILYGVREFAMGCINNGIASHSGLIPTASGFLVFSDYIKPAMRLASIMELQQLYVFTHDSIAVGEDGPTHEPIEQLAMIRSIPNHITFRPCDFQETLASYKLALNDYKNCPTTIILSRQDLPQLEHNDVFSEVEKGAYIISDKKDATVSLMASGSEVGLAMEIQKELEKQNIISKVISVPSINVFEKQSDEYKDKIIDNDTFKVAIEMSADTSWYKYLDRKDIMIGINKFGESAPANIVIEKYGFTKENITKIIIDKLK